MIELSHIARVATHYLEPRLKHEPGAWRIVMSPNLFSEWCRRLRARIVQLEQKGYLASSSDLSKLGLPGAWSVDRFIEDAAVTYARQMLKTSGEFLALLADQAKPVQQDQPSKIIMPGDGL